MSAVLASLDTPQHAEVAEQLERILADVRFVSSERSSSFLRYVVERTLAGRASEIKELVIAVELYARTTGYDPKADSTVRVEASRVRARLQDYYTHKGAFDPIRIAIPKGAYVPTFDRNHAVPVAEPASEPVATKADRPGRDRQMRGLAAQWSILVMAAASLVLAWWLWRPDRVGAEPGPGSRSRPRRCPGREPHGLARRQRVAPAGSALGPVGSRHAADPCARHRALRARGVQEPGICPRLGVARGSLRIRICVRRAQRRRRCEKSGGRGTACADARSEPGRGPCDAGHGPLLPAVGLRGRRRGVSPCPRARAPQCVGDRRVRRPAARDRAPRAGGCGHSSGPGAAARAADPGRQGGRDSARSGAPGSGDGCRPRRHRAQARLRYGPTWRSGWHSRRKATSSRR